MTTVLRAEVQISAQNQLRPGLAKAAAALDKFRQQQTKVTAQAAQMERMERAAGALRGAMAGVGGAAVLAGLAAANKRFAEVDRAMTRIGITGDASAKQTREGMISLRNVANEVALPFDQVREGMDQITASGRDFGDALKMMPSVARTAQASGAQVSDIANSSTALIDQMKISIDGLQLAQDTLAKGGKLGRFELKDMARYLPSMLPAFRALGYEGQQGLERLVATLQVIRMGTGTAEEAAASANNIFAKMESEATVKNFKDMGVDLPKALAKARKEGKDLLEVFTDLTRTALKGDMSKLPQLFNDMEFARGMRAMLGGVEARKRFLADLRNASGTIATDLKRVTDDSQAALDRFGNAADRARTALGSLVTQVASPALSNGAENLNSLAEGMERIAKAAREKGPAAAAKDAVGGFIQSVVDDARAGRAQYNETASAAGDDTTLSLMTRRRQATPADAARLSEIDRELARLEGVRGGPGSAAEQRARQIAALRRDRAAIAGRSSAPLTDDESGAFARDQLRRSGLGGDIAAPDFSDILDAAREARRNAAFAGVTSGPMGGGSGRRVNAPEPPRRPSDLGGPAMIPAQGFDEANAKAETLKSTVIEIGPAAMTATQQIAVGVSSAVDRAVADIDRLQMKLNSLRGPSLSFAGLNTGPSMNEAR
jgi:TP901 family phage tail tape measure protein